MNNKSSTNSLQDVSINLNDDRGSRKSLFQKNLANIHVDSPGKFSSKVYHEKELAHESHLIHNQMQQRMSNVDAMKEESFQGAHNEEAGMGQNRVSRNQNMQDQSSLSVQQHKAQMLSQ